MVSRERLLSLAATLTDRATSKRARLLAQLLLGAALVFAGLRVRSLWHGNHVEVANVGWGALAGALVLAAAATIGTALVWLAILDTLGVRTQVRWAGIFLQAQLGKYIPGSVWQYAGRAAVARAHGIPVRPVTASLAVEFGASAAAAGSMAALLLGWWGSAILAPLALLTIAIQRFSNRPAAVAAVRAMLLYLPVWLALGVSFWLCAHALVTVRANDLPVYTGAFAVAWVAGLLAFYAPGGLGVRETVLVALLSSRIGAANALVVAAASRLILIVIDVVLAGLATVTLRRSRPHLDIADVT